jgi:Flp pilus assembly CpaF family ATPase
MVNGPHEIWIEREGLRTGRRPFLSHHRGANKMVAEVGRRIDSLSRWSRSATDGAASTRSFAAVVVGALLTVRKFGSERLNLDALA